MRYTSNNYETLWNWTNWSETLSLFYTTSSGPVIVCPPNIARVQAVRFNTDTQLSYGAPGFFFQTDPNVFDRIGSPTMFTRLNACGVAIQPSGTTITISAVSGGDIGQQVVLHGTYLGNEQKETITLASTPVTTVSLWDQIEGFSKPITTNLVTMTNPSAVVLVTLQPWENEKKHQRIMILEQALTNYTVLILGKRRCPTLTDLNDSPMLRGADNVLIPMLEADLLRRDREYTKAQLKDAEAKAQVEKLIEEETNQEAYSARIQPVCAPNYWSHFGYPYSWPMYTK